jgi:cyclopropane-fatty-acyl-phospholipid synthase
LRLLRARAVTRLFLGGDVGFAEAYMDGDWDSPDLAALIELVAHNERALGAGVRGAALARFWHRIRHVMRPNTRRGAKRNIADHYDLGNDFYSRWLDPGMTYSSALYDRPEATLSEAQQAKYARIANELSLRPEHRVLEIGCGWGGFAEFVGRHFGCRVKGITLSHEQRDFALGRIHAAGLADRVEIDLLDYRDVKGEYDRIASIEMFEAVGEENWPDYFEAIRDRLCRGGLAVLQVITIDEARYAAYRRSADFIQRYVFPGGMLPAPSVFRRAVERTGLSLTDAFHFGRDYARTLCDWQQRFQREWPAISGLGFDQRFKRLWEYYLAYCEGGFRAGSIDVVQYKLARL